MSFSRRPYDELDGLKKFGQDYRISQMNGFKTFMAEPNGFVLKSAIRSLARISHNQNHGGTEKTSSKYPYYHERWKHPVS